MSAARLTLPSPAKLNLMLHILGRRPDGYHELQTIFFSSWTTATKSPLPYATTA
nr:hypothetical protein GCM10020185_47500 [Pseudomonas brassicacearum subsp. brassicacearum]